MFDYSMWHWVSFLGAAALLNVSPGPDLAYIIGQTMRHGRAVGIASMLGAWTGVWVHVLLATLGLSTLLLASAEILTLVKWAGGVYLIWLGVEIWRSRGSDLALTSERRGRGTRLRQAYSRGVLVSALKPKVAAFFLAFLPQFVVPGAGPISAQLLLHGALIVLVAATIEPWIVLGAARAARTLAQRPAIGRWLDRVTATVLIGFGCELIVDERL